MKRFGKAVAALAVAVCTLFGGVATANAYDFDNIQHADNIGSTSIGAPVVSEIGAHTANVSFTYSIDPSILPKVASVCFAVEVQRITSIKPIAHEEWVYGYLWASNVDCQGGVNDDDLTAESYRDTYGTKTKQYKEVGTVAAEATGQYFSRYEKEQWNGAATGTAQVPVIGLEPNTNYGNTRVFDGYNYYYNPGSAVLVTSDALYAKGVRAATPVDLKALYAGMRIVMKDGSVATFADTAKRIPDFTTKSEPTAKPAEALPSKTDAKLDVANGHAEPGQTARVYVDNLKAEAKGKADANSLFWNAYIYSEPQALTGPDGAPFVRVQKEASTGKYYFDAVIPADLPAGEHKISVQDENGTVQAWTPVTVGDTPAPVDKSKLTAAVDAAGKLAEKDYTADSWTPFAKALADAQAVAAKQDASQADVDAAVKALADAQAGLKKAETVPSKPVEPSKPSNNNKPSNNKPSNNKPANDKPAADDKKSESKNDEQSDLSKTGASVIGVAGMLALLVVLAAGFLVVGKARR